MFLNEYSGEVSKLLINRGTEDNEAKTILGKRTYEYEKNKSYIFGIQRSNSIIPFIP